LTNMRIELLTGSGSFGHALIMPFNSGSSGIRPVAFSVAVEGRIASECAGSWRV
jgi:hypothetical protein